MRVCFEMTENPPPLVPWSKQVSENGASNNVSDIFGACASSTYEFQRRRFVVWFIATRVFWKKYYNSLLSFLKLSTVPLLIHMAHTTHKILYLQGGEGTSWEITKALSSKAHSFTLLLNKFLYYCIITHLRHIHDLRYSDRILQGKLLGAYFLLFRIIILV